MKRILTAAILVAAFGPAAMAQNKPPFGSDADALYAAVIWKAIEAQNLTGDNMIRAYPYDGTDPHGKMLETFYTNATIEDHAGALIVKRNFGPEGVTEDEVLADPGKHLSSVTVMYRREAGFDPDNANWFWAKYMPDGSLAKNPKGMRLAGRVAKGFDKGCIACHANAPGDDYLWTTDAIK